MTVLILLQILETAILKDINCTLHKSKGQQFGLQKSRLTLDESEDILNANPFLSWLFRFSAVQICCPYNNTGFPFVKIW